MEAPDNSTAGSTFEAVRQSIANGHSPLDFIERSCRRAAAAAQDGIFTALVPPAKVMERAESLVKLAREGHELPLLGLTFSVKDNIHVRHMATTANCPGLKLFPEESAPVVSTLERAGALLIGKNTMDQFATGLNGTRSPLPLCRNAIDPEYIPGGSSSGSAVAVARDVVSFSLGSDTGGSGRVPAACNGIVGVKPTIGLVSSRGLIYNSRFLDCVPVFARNCADANEILRLIAGFDRLDPFSRPDANQIDCHPKLAGPMRVAVPRATQRQFFGDAIAEAAYQSNLQILSDLGFSLVEIDFTPFEEAGRLVFESAMVAERTVDYAEVLAKSSAQIHPIVLAALDPASRFSARDAFEAIYRMVALRRLASDILSDFAALVVPTIPTIFTIKEMLEEPVMRNNAMGTYTYFVNPMDLCAVSVPGIAQSGGLRSALSFVGLAGQDGTVAGLAAQFEKQLCS